MNCDKKLEETKRNCCTVRYMITLHILQYSYSIVTGSASVCCCIGCINCTAVDGWKKCTEVMAVATQFVQKWCYRGTFCCGVQWLIAVLPVLQWHCLLCSTAIDCFSPFVINFLKQSNFDFKYRQDGRKNIVHNSGLCLHTAACNYLLATLTYL